MCPPVPRCGTGTVPIKREMAVNRGKRAAVGGGPYGVVRGGSIIGGRVAEDGDPYGGFRKPVARRGRAGGEYKECGVSRKPFSRRRAGPSGASRHLPQGGRLKIIPLY